MFQPNAAIIRLKYMFFEVIVLGSSKFLDDIQIKWLNLIKCLFLKKLIPIEVASSACLVWNDLSCVSCNVYMRNNQYYNLKNMYLSLMMAALGWNM
jgi:hypothetical protein